MTIRVVHPCLHLYGTHKNIPLLLLIKTVLTYSFYGLPLAICKNYIHHVMGIMLMVFLQKVRKFRDYVAFKNYVTYLFLLFVLSSFGYN